MAKRTQMSYERYWDTVFGPGRDVDDVLNEFDLRGSTRRDLDEWLGVAESEAIALCRLPQESLDGWAEYHERALTDLADQN